MKMSGKGFGSNLLNLRRGAGVWFSIVQWWRWQRDSLVCSITE